MLSYRSSIIGFHNPKKHKGLTAEKFLKKYTSSLYKKRYKKGGRDRMGLKIWIEEHWKEQIKFVERLFPETLKIKKKI